MVFSPPLMGNQWLRGLVLVWDASEAAGGQYGSLGLYLQGFVKWRSLGLGFLGLTLNPKP